MADVITVGVDLQAKVARTLGVSPSGVKFLCGNSHGKIVIWDRYKPIGGIPMNVCRSGKSGETLLVVNSALGTKYWQGMDGNCGFSFPQLIKVEEIMNYCDGSLNGWKYNAPSSTDYNRIGDFIGYCHSVPADNGIGSVSLRGGSFNEGDTGASVIFGALPPTDTALGFSDFFGLRDSYFGVLVRKVGSSGTGFRVIAAGTVASGDTSVLLTGKGDGRPVEDTWMGETSGTSPMLGQGKYEIFPFLYRKSAGVYIPIPYAKGGAGSGGMSIEVSAAPKMRVIAWLSDVSNKLATLNVTVSNIPYANSEVTATVSFYSINASININQPPASSILYGRPQNFSGTASGNSITWSRLVAIEDAAWIEGGVQLLAEAGLPGSTAETAKSLSSESW